MCKVSVQTTRKNLTHALRLTHVEKHRAFSQGSEFTHTNLAVFTENCYLGGLSGHFEKIVRCEIRDIWLILTTSDNFRIVITKHRPQKVRGTVLEFGKVTGFSIDITHAP